MSDKKINDCRVCGEEAECYSITNPETERKEYWVRPRRFGRCREVINADNDISFVCDSGSYNGKGNAIKAWNNKFGKKD